MVNIDAGMLMKEANVVDTNIQFRTCDKFDLSVVNKFTLVYTSIDGSLSGNSPNQLEFKLQDATTNTMNPWENQSYNYCCCKPIRYLGYCRV